MCLLFDLSIGEPQELDRSVSSTKPHTVNLYADAQELPAPVVEIAPARNARVASNSAMSNSDSAIAPATSSSTNEVIT